VNFLDEIISWIFHLPRRLGLIRRHRSVNTAKGSDRELETRIRKDLAFLFEEHGASVTSNNYYPRAFGNAIVEMQAGNVLFRIVKDRREHEIRVDVAPISQPDEWEFLDTALAICTGENRDNLGYFARYDDNPRKKTYIGMTEIARLLAPRFAALNDSFLPVGYERIRAEYMKLHGEPWLTSFKVREGRKLPSFVKRGDEYQYDDGTESS
jgi:hypothetical protein